MRLYLTRLTLPDTPAERRRLLSRGVHRLLSRALADAGIAPVSVLLCRTPEGKPYLTFADGTPVGMECSLSHSGSWAVCALSDASGVTIGIDLERIRSVSPALWRRFLAETPDEPVGDGYTAILRWTRYEAALKCAGHAPHVMPPADAFCTLRLIPGYLLTAVGEAVSLPPRFVSEIELNRFETPTNQALF
ncbi:MAG: 4'-phosphopantetheinyl transferase family protein [Eubacteriales bacterium]